MKLKYVIPSALLSLMVSCGAQGGATKSIEEGEWQVVSLYEQAISGADEDSYTITFGAENQLSGKGECNRLMGKYTIKDGGKLSIEAVGSTMMFCPNIEQEDRFKSGLESVTRYTIEGDKLTLYSGNNAVAVLK